MENPLISVIITVYNKEKYLDQCIASIAAQSYPKLEIIIIDDESKDSSAQICMEWTKKDSRVKFFHKKNGGVSTAKNMGIDCSSGELIAFLDGDDYVDDPDMFTIMQKELSESNSDIVRCGIKRVDENGNLIEKVTLKTTDYSGKDAMAKTDDGLFVMNSLSLSKKEIFDGVRFPEGRIHEDTAVAHVMLFKANKVRMLDYAPVCYRINENSLTHGLLSAKRLDLITAIYDRFIFFEKNRFPQYLPKTCECAKNSMGLIAKVSISTKEDREKRAEAIKMYRYIYKHTPGLVSGQCLLCYLFPIAYNGIKKVLGR